MAEDPVERSASRPEEPPRTAAGASFATTRWSVVLAARGGASAEAREALEALFRAYWYPLYAFLRRRGLSPEDAQDVGQGFFARLLEKEALTRVDPGRGRFRSFLVASLENFLANERDRARAKKRGGGRGPISIDAREGEERYALEPTDPLTPEKLFERRWALTLIERTLERLRGAWAAEGKERLFEALRSRLAGESGAPSHADVASELGTTPEAVKAAVYRLRKRFRRELREEIAQTVSRPEDVDDEIRDLFAALES